MDNATRILRNMIDSANGSHRDIASLSGVSEVSISRYYSGTRTPSLKTFFKIANACGYFIADSKPTIDADKAAKIFKNCAEDSLNAKETQSYMKTVLSALRIYKMFGE